MSNVAIQFLHIGAKRGFMHTYLGVNVVNWASEHNLDISTISLRKKAYELIRLDILQAFEAQGVKFFDYSEVYVDCSVKIGQGTLIYPNQLIEGNTIIGQDCTLFGGNHIKDAYVANGATVKNSILSSCRIGAKCTVGPYAHVHTNSKIEKGCRIGNFVEVKNSTVGINTKIAHLAYVGDVDIGNQCNVGCGSIFVNFDGKNKHRSQVGDSVFVGSNANVIAPVKIDDNAYIAAGTTVTVDLPKDCMCIGRSRETVKHHRSKYHKNVFEKKYFGTDGIRGVYNKDLTDNVAYMVGNFLGYSSSGGKVVLARDTRLSGEKLCTQLARGLTDAGADVVWLGVTSTPSVAYTVTAEGANYGVVVSASHNTAEFNGIKLFNNDGRKLTDIEEVEIENHIASNTPYFADVTGKMLDGKDFLLDYTNNLAKNIGSLDSLKIVLDCANGAISHLAPALFEKLGATVYPYFCDGDGSKINDGCGAVHPQFAQEKVVQLKADIGFCYDGDADRLIAINEKGELVDGDSLLYIFANHLKAQDKLAKNTVVGTILSNMGLEQSLEEMGISLVRTDVGDHKVVEKMIRDGYVLGGENSGHLILREFSNTGDGLLASLYLAKLLKKSGLPLSKLDTCKHYPQTSINIPVSNKSEIMTNQDLNAFVEQLQIEHAQSARILLRASGTEPKIRIMVESEQKQLASELANRIKDFIQYLL